MSDRRPVRLLWWTAGAWTLLQIVHTLDHARQEREVPVEARFLGLAGYVATAALLVLLARRHRLAPWLAALLGGGVLAGFVAVHVVPRWWPLSDPYAEFDLDALAWTLMIVPALSGLALAVAGMTAARHRGTLAHQEP